MKKRNGGRSVAERKLFHGTDPKFINAICFSNFDWRICGTHGTAYGKGKQTAMTTLQDLKVQCVR
jgi:poly [ADP-ribose] polymerase 7/11/12/13